MRRIYKLAASGTTTATDGAASIDMRENGRIYGLSFCIRSVTAAGAPGGIQGEVSFAAVNSLTTNDSQIAIGAVVIYANASGTWQENHFIDVGGLEYAAGERLYLNMVETGALTDWQCQAYLYVDEGGGGGSSVRDARGRFLRR